VPFDWNSGALAEGVRCYRNEQFWLAHEHWESVWLRLQQPEKTFLQSLIQITAAFHHLQTGNTRGAISLLRRALHRLEPYPTPFRGIDLAQLRKKAGEWLLALESGTEPRPKSFPQIFPMLHDPDGTTRATRS
jgi:uncharacterized protein